MDKHEILDKLEIPPDPKLGEFAFPCFILAKSMNKAPAKMAEELSAKISDTMDKEVIAEVKSVGPYINFFLGPGTTGNVLQEIIEKGAAYAKKPPSGKTYMMEFFHANTHKGVHIGHIRNMCLGEAMSRIFESQGIEVKRVNYQGDIGPHVVKCMWGYVHGNAGKEPKTNRGVWLGSVYSEANRRIKDDEKLELEIREMTKRLYEGDKELVDLWKKTRQWCLDDFEKMYKEFDVRFDRLYFESEVEKRGREIVRDALDKGIARKSEGAVIIDLKKEDLGVFVVLRSDGMPLYSTKDLALAELKSEEFEVDKSIHLVGKEQELYFKQLFRTFDLIGSPMAGRSHHLVYELVMLPEGKMSSREGTVVWYEDLKVKLLELAEREIRKRHENWAEEKIEATAYKIAFSALKFAMINRDNNRVLVFDWEKALDFEGETGPYVQYTYARISSILRKAKRPEDPDLSKIADDERNIISLLERYPEVVSSAAASMRPMNISRYLLDLCQVLNEYYHKHPVLKAKPVLRDMRIYLLSSAQVVIKDALELLAIDVLDEM